MLKAFAFDYESGAYIGIRELGLSDIDPRAPQTLLVPGDCTLTPPPRCGVGLWPFWRDGQWQVFEQVETPGELFFSEYDN